MVKERHGDKAKGKVARVRSGKYELIPGGEILEVHAGAPLSRISVGHRDLYFDSRTGKQDA